MYSATSYTIRPATDDDAALLAHLAVLDSQPTIEGPALIGEIGGRAAAALSLRDGRIVADPFQRTAQLATHLRDDASGGIDAPSAQLFRRQNPGPSIEDLHRVDPRLELPE